ncbi:hypothetical protein EDD21DRAFT_110602 [Dissophora ornata]|nr:hypothetical protein EDD21DRAFT_110602 [Dissophora ornata]
MGVEGVFPHLEEQKVLTPRVDMANIRGVHVDVLSLYHSYIKSTHKRLTYDAFRQEPNSVQHAAINSQMAQCLHNKLSKTFTQTHDTVLHLDGPSTSQKARARGARRSRRAKDLQDVRDLSEKILMIVATANTTSGSKRRTQRRKLLRLNQKLKERWGMARTIDTGMKADQAAGLEELGWEMCRCQGEADVCIGRRENKLAGQVVVASCDSDMLFHGVKELLRKEPGADVYTSYSVADVIQMLQVNEAQWVVAGVVTNNDYTGQIRGQSFKKNLAVLRECDAVDKQDILHQYCAKMGVSSTRFDSATDVVFKRLETTETDSTSSDGVDGDMKEMVNVVTKYVKQTRTNKAHEASGP